MTLDDQMADQDPRPQRLMPSLIWPTFGEYIGFGLCCGGLYNGNVELHVRITLIGAGALLAYISRERLLDNIAVYYADRGTRSVDD